MHLHSPACETASSQSSKLVYLLNCQLLDTLLRMPSAILATLQWLAFQNNVCEGVPFIRSSPTGIIVVLPNLLWKDCYLQTVEVQVMWIEQKAYFISTCWNFNSEQFKRCAWPFGLKSKVLLSTYLLTIPPHLYEHARGGLLQPTLSGRNKVVVFLYQGRHYSNSQ